MCKTPGLGIAALLCAVTASPVNAGLDYTLVTDIVREDNGVQKERIVERVTVDGDKGRIDFLGPDGRKPQNGASLLTLDGGKTFALSEGREAVCADWSTQKFFRTIGELLDKGTRFVNADLSDAKVEKTLEEPGPPMHGYPTTHLRMVSRYGAKGQILFKKFEFAVEETDDLWMTSELEMPALERRWIEATAQTGFEYVDAMSEVWNAAVTGTVLKRRGVTRLTDLRSKEVSVKTETVEVTKLETLDPSQLSQAAFIMPTCNQVDKRDMKKAAQKLIDQLVR
jgi:hypothetical protein